MANSTQERAAEAQELLDEEVTPGDPGVATLVMTPRGVVFRGCAGLADLRRKTAISPATVFDLASVSKHFTAAAVLLLASRGALKLGDAVSSRLADYDVEEEERPVRIQDLLWHTSGLPDYTGDDWDGSDEEFMHLTCEEHVRWISKIEPHRPPGEEYEYNNSGYALLARIVEEVSGKAYSRFMQDEFFDPLAMKSTLALDDLSRKIPGRAVGYKGGRKEDFVVSSSPSVIQGDGNLFTCIDDLILWEKSLREGTILPRSWLDRAFTNGRLDDGSPIEDEEGYGYGFGWSIDEDSGCVFHGGSWDGTAAQYNRYTDEGLTIVVLSNDEDMDVSGLADGLYEIFSDLLPLRWSPG
jgi:CubicO group peptidase (beta-lactamase class C family)